MTLKYPVIPKQAPAGRLQDLLFCRGFQTVNLLSLLPNYASQCTDIQVDDPSRNLETFFGYELTAPMLGKLVGDRGRKVVWKETTRV